MLGGLRRDDGVPIVNVAMPLLAGYDTSVPVQSVVPLRAGGNVPTGVVTCKALLRDEVRARLVFGFHDAGGQSVANLDDDPNTGTPGQVTPYNNAEYWLTQVKTLADAGGVTARVTEIAYDQGEADNAQPRGWWLERFRSTYGQMLEQIERILGQEGTPRLYLHQTGGYMAQPTSHWMVLEQLEALDEWGGVLVGPNYPQLIDNADGRGVHRAMSSHIQAGELRAWAIAETEAGRAWNLLPGVALRSGNTITIPISIRDDESLTTVPGKYQAYGGDPDNLGLQVVGGGSIVSASVLGNSILIEVIGTVTAVRYAFQRDNTTDWREYLDAAGCGYVRNRGLIRTTLTRSVIVAGLPIQIERWVPSFELAIP